MKILKVLSLLLDYPTDELFNDGNFDDCKQVIQQSKFISASVAEQLITLIDEMIAMGSIEAQARYDSLFERGRSLSLWLFEHVHGESRDRGQAMVDLMNQYEEFGFEIGVKELPDFIPLYLEFLSHKANMINDDIQIRMDVADVSHIVALLTARLKERNSNYVACMYALLEIANKPLSIIEQFQKQVSNEIPDNSTEAIDKEWEEEVVDFLSAEQESRCPSDMTTKTGQDKLSLAEKQAVVANKQVDVPVHWVDFSQPNHNQSSQQNKQGVKI